MSQMKRSKKGSARTVAQEEAMKHNWALFQLSGMLVNAQRLRLYLVISDPVSLTLINAIQAGIDELRLPTIKGK